MHHLPKSIEQKVKNWLSFPYDEKTQKELQLLLQNGHEKVYDAFYTHLSFGTAGLRGLMGVGTNRINQYTIGMATQGLANFLNKTYPNIKKSVVIAFDSRINSSLYAEEAAKILAGNHIYVYLSKELRPTPFLSFMCLCKKASAAIMITASHNPPEYNGYKVYSNHGGQILPPYDEMIMSEVEKVSDVSLIKKESLNSSYINYLDDSADEAYIETLKKLQNRASLCQKDGKDLRILYSNMHGTGITLLPQVLASWGFCNFHFVEEQKIPSGHFPGAKNPNPESKEAMAKGLEILSEKKYDLFLATDPDADRVGVGVRSKDHPQLLSGHSIAALCTYYLLTTYQEQNRLLPSHTVISTIVTTRLIKKMCSYFKVHYIDVLTGFKYIGEKIKEFENDKDHTFLFGAEESYGYLYGTHARDKDAIITSALLCEMALFYKMEGKTLLDVLDEIYQKFGLFQEKQLSIQLPDEAKSFSLIEKALNELRSHPPKVCDGIYVKKVMDYNQRNIDHLPKSNVISLELEDNTLLIIRPSGTEPKIKIYGMLEKPASFNIKEAQTLLDKRLLWIKKELLKL